MKKVSDAGRPIYLNLASGPRGLAASDWINIDGFPDKNVHFLLDLNRRLSFADDSLDGVFCEHVIEHFCFEDGERLMKEVRRCLRRGGVGRLIVPDAERIMQTYFTNPKKLVELRVKGQGTAIEAINSYFHQRYEHQFLYDWTTMKLMLERAGFKKIFRSSFGSTELCSALMLDDPKYEWESLYVEVQK